MKRIAFALFLLMGAGPLQAQTTYTRSSLTMPAHLLDIADPFGETAHLHAVLAEATTAVQGPTLFPAAGMRAVDGLYKGVNPQDDNARRVAIKRVCEQMQFDLGDSWGNKKRAGLSDDFLSPDSIAFRESNGTVSVWDVQASSGAILVFEGKPADHPNLPTSEAAFMDCTATNHLGGGGTDPEPTPPPTGGDLEPRVLALEQWAQVAHEALTRMSADIANLVEQVAALGNRVVNLEARPVVVGCKAAAFGIPLSCSLVTQ